jgi:hypothetical protein
MLEASRPVSTLAALPVQSDWYEHKVKGTDGIVFYRNKGSDRVTYEDPYKSTLAAAADVAADDADGYDTLLCDHFIYMCIDDIERYMSYIYTLVSLFPHGSNMPWLCDVELTHITHTPFIYVIHIVRSIPPYYMIRGAS